jgi:hypothetical protein
LYFGCQDHLRGTTSVRYVVDKGKNIGFLIIDFDGHDISTFLSAPSSDTTLPCGMGKTSSTGCRDLIEQLLGRLPLLEHSCRTVARSVMYLMD